MLKRSIALIQQWLSPQQSDDVCTARRGFFKRAALGAVSVTGTAGLAKVVVDSTPQPDIQEKYIKSGLAGEQELIEREYVLMSDREKQEMVQRFVDNHSGQA